MRSLYSLIYYFTFVFLFAVRLSAETFSVVDVEGRNAKIHNHDGSLKKGDEVRLFDWRGSPSGRARILSSSKKGGTVSAAVFDGKAVVNGTGVPSKVMKATKSRMPAAEQALKEDATEQERERLRLERQKAEQAKSARELQSMIMRQKEDIDYLKSKRAVPFHRGILFGTHVNWADSYRGTLNDGGSANDVTIKTHPQYGIDFGYERSFLGPGFQTLVYWEPMRYVRSTSSNMPGLDSPKTIEIIGGELSLTYGERYFGKTFTYKAGVNLVAFDIKGWTSTNTDLSGRYGGYGYHAGIGWNFSKHWSANLDYRFAGGKNSHGNDSMFGMVFGILYSWDATKGNKFRDMEDE